MMYTYQIYKSSNTSNARYNKARENFGYEGENMYIVLKDGMAVAVQSDSCHPFGGTLIECAEADVAQRNAEISEQEV